MYAVRQWLSGKHSRQDPLAIVVRKLAQHVMHWPITKTHLEYIGPPLKHANKTMPSAENIWMNFGPECIRRYL